MPNILITGANRGLGLGLVAAYLAEPNNTVIAAVRDPKDARSQSMKSLPVGVSSSLIFVTIESTSETSALAAIAELQAKHSVKSLDLVVANAGIADTYPRVSEAKPEDMLRHYHVNVIGTVLLFQAVLPLLSATQVTPKFVAMSSTAGTLIDMEIVAVPNAAYGPSKTALNWIAKKIQLENENIIAFPISPGWVQTDMGNAGARAFGMEKAILELDTSIQGMVKVIAAATRENSGGKFLSYDGTETNW